MKNAFQEARTLAKDEKLVAELEKAIAENDVAKVRSLLGEGKKLAGWEKAFDKKFIEYLNQYSNSITNPKGINKVWRVLRDDQSAYSEIIAKSENGLTKSGSPFTIEGHVGTGSRTETPYISSFQDKGMAIERGLKDGKAVVEIDLTKVEGHFFDLSDEMVRNSLIKNPRTRRFAQASSEFLIVTDRIPLNAIKPIK